MAIIQTKNGQKTIITTGDRISSFSPEPNVNYLGIDSDTNTLQQLKENGDVIDYSTGGGGDLVDIQYTELYNKTVDGELEPEKWYRLTDYRSVNFLNGWEIANNNPAAISGSGVDGLDILDYFFFTFPNNDRTETATCDTTTNGTGRNLTISITYGMSIPSPGWTYEIVNPGTGYAVGDEIYVDISRLPLGLGNINNPDFLTLVVTSTTAPSAFSAREIHEGETEVLLLQATSPYEISEIGYSETFNGDIVQYEPYVNKIGVDFDIYNRQTLPDLSTVSGFDLQWDGTNVYFNMPEGYPVLFGHYFYLYCEFDGGNYYQDGAFDPITPGISVCQYPYTSDDPDYGYPKAMSRIRVENNGMKVVLLDLDETDFNNYDLDSLYVNTVYEIGDTYGWITRRQDTFRNIDVPFDFRERKYRRFEVDLNPINSSFGTDYWGQGDEFLGLGTTGDFKDFKCFGNDGYEAYNIKWSDMGGPDMYWYRGYNDNNVFFGSFYNNTVSSFYNNTVSSFYDNIVGPNFYNNTVSSFYDNIAGSNFYDNIVADQFNNNELGNYSFNNIVGSNFYYNTVGVFFFNNTVDRNFQGNKVGDQVNNNELGDNFINNIVGNSFQSNSVNNNFQNNIVGTNFQVNIVGIGFYNNIVSTEFFNNRVGNGFLNNTIKIPVSSTNFTSATHVYGDYNCEIFKRSDGSLQLRYVDNRNMIQYSAIAA
jgi:hypothetical protein